MSDDAHDADSRPSRVRFWLLVTAGPILLIGLYVASIGPVYAGLAVMIDLEAASQISYIIYYPLAKLAEANEPVADLLSAYVLWWLELAGIMFP